MDDDLKGAGGRPDYRSGVNAALLALCAVDYDRMVEMAPAMDPQGAAIRGAEAAGVEPGEFALAFRRVHGLAEAGDSPRSRERAAGHNERRAAVICFASEHRLWKLGRDGNAYLGVPGGMVLQMKAGDGGNTWVMSQSAEMCVLGGPVDALGRVDPPGGVAFEPVCEDVDIVDLLKAERRLRPAREAAWHGMDRGAVERDPEDSPERDRAGAMGLR